MTEVARIPDAYEEAVGLVQEAGKEGVSLRLAGGLAIRYLCPDFPPRVAEKQDVDMACHSKARPAVTAFLEDRDYASDKTFNALYGHKQLFFKSPYGRSVDVLVDKLEMCHELLFSDRVERMSFTLDPCDLLLSKLQIVELNEKDAQDVLYLLAAFPVKAGDEIGTIGLRRFEEIVGEDWGWWRTVTMNLERIRSLAEDDPAHLVPSNAHHDPVQQLRNLEEAAQAAPKSIRWRLRAKVGQRVRWYRVPEETPHY